MNQRRRLQGSAAVACAACRRLKMRCVGADNPPCVRCTKARRDCVVPVPYQASQLFRSTDADAGRIEDTDPTPNSSTGHVQLQPTIQSDTSFSTHTSGRATPRSRLTPPLEGRQPSRAHLLVNLPSIYSVVPLETISQHSRSRMNESERSHRYLRLAERNDPVSHTRLRPQSPTNIELTHLLQFFRTKVIQNVPIIAPEDLADMTSLVESKAPVAICIAFVTAGLVPGCKPIQLALLGDVGKILACKHDIVNAGRTAAWSLLQGLGILFLYTSPHNGDTHTYDWTLQGELTPWSLKASLESLAMRLGLYRSCEEVTRVKEADAHDLISSFAFKQYLFWLWLFNVAHHYSMLTRTPPSIQLDSTIRSASDILSGLEHIPHVRKVLAEVELYQLWANAGQKCPSMGEWWCPPRIETDLMSVTATLKSLDEAVDQWCERWRLLSVTTEPSMTPSRHNDATVDFLSRYIRFHTSTFLTRCLQITSCMEPSNSNRLLVRPIEDTTCSADTPKALLSKLIQTASTCSTFYSELDPFAKDTARYITPFGFAMVSFSCYFIIKAAELLWSSDMDLSQYLDGVVQAAEFMREIGKHEDDAPRVYAERIFTRLERLYDRDRGSDMTFSMQQSCQMGSRSRQEPQEWLQTSMMTGGHVASLELHETDRESNLSDLQGSNQIQLPTDFQDMDAFWRENYEDLFGTDPAWMFNMT